MVTQNIERRLGELHNQTRVAAEQAALRQCPPVSPSLLAHLELMFSYPVEVSPKHPQLSQLLIMQLGVEKVLDYLRRHYDSQSELARKAHAV